MDSETIYAILGATTFASIAFFILRNDKTATIQTQEEKCYEIVNGYRKEIRDSLALLKEDKEAQIVKRKELLLKFNDELSRNIFFDDFDVREIIQELSILDS